MYNRAIQIDDLTRIDHYRLEPGDICFYLGEYTARESYSYSDTNQLIFNLKKPTTRKGCGDYRHKIRAINTVAEILAWLMGDGVAQLTFVPIPPSKVKSDPEYDDRLVQILSKLKALDSRVEYKELILQKNSTRASHDSGNRLSVQELIDNYCIDEMEARSITRDSIVIFDDVLTAGNHFKAMQEVIRSRFPAKPLYGFFVARSVRGAVDPSEFF